MSTGQAMNTNSAFAELGVSVLVVDSSENAPIPQAVALMDLRDAIESLSTHVSYLAARGLPLHFVNTHGSTAGFVNRLMDVVPQAEVLLIHASATDLCRLLGRSSGSQSVEAWAQDVRPLLLVDDRPTSVTHAYAGLKLLAQRGRLMVHDFLLGAAETSPRAPRIAEQLTSCAEHFLGAVVREVLMVDPATDARDCPPELLRRWARASLQPTSGTTAGITTAPASSGSPLDPTSPAFYGAPIRPNQRTDLNTWS